MVQSTNETSSQIDLAITGIADGANNQAEDVEQSTHQITDLGNFMDDMVSNVGELDSTSAHMKESSIEECNKVIINVNQLMINLSAISEENAASTTETADSMQVLNHTINNLLTESQKLLAASSDLEKDMQSFIL